MSVFIHRLPSVLSATGYSRSALYLHIAQGLWIKPIKLGSRAVGWPSDEVHALLQARIAGWSEAQIRQLIAELQSKRASAWGAK